jgi:serine/threonine protein phosphatase PrpC
MDVKVDLDVAGDITVRALKEQLADLDPTGRTDPTNLRLSSGPGTPTLLDGEQLPANLGELELSDSTDTSASDSTDISDPTSASDSSSPEAAEDVTAALMRRVDSTQPGRVITIAQPEDFMQSPPPMWGLSKSVSAKHFDFDNHNGIQFGNVVTRTEPLPGTASGVISIWNKDNYKECIAQTVTPWAAVDLETLTAHWQKRSFIMWYWNGEQQVEAKAEAEEVEVSNEIEMLTPAGAYNHLTLPGPGGKGCSVARWREMLASGELLGAKVLYVNKLRCHPVDADATGDQLDEAAPLPTRPRALAIFGPDSVIQMLDNALAKKLGPPNKARKAEKAKPSQPTTPLEGHGEDAKAKISYFFRGLKGQRDYMEDRSCVKIGMIPRSKHHMAMFGVFDGHGGDKVAELVARFLPGILEGELGEKDPVKALERAFYIADTNLQNSDRSGAHPFALMGTTAVVVLLVTEPSGKTKLFCANAGDSRAVLCRKGLAVALSTDHKPEVEEEQARIEAAGGRVGMKGRIELGGSETGLNVSRGLGDFAYKARRELPHDKQFVIAHPEVTVFDIGPDDEFFCLGSDGMFETMNNDDLVARLRKDLSKGDSMERVVQGALEEALPGGDNCIMSLVRFVRGVS